ncbi:hypothetical protein [Patulibacter minatonensis]|uniref:hypothetical protein n=1 Tax=Patulibacter minatonensis TaxID=298163 RepID=UPI0004792C3B|nr:hypothetical protein [Patulibacter minatonensis]
MRVPRTSLITLATAVAALGAASGASAATWQPDSNGNGIGVDLAAPVADTVNDPRVATTQDGTAVSAWYTADDPTVQVAIRAPGAAWVGPLDLTALAAVQEPYGPLGGLAGVDDVQVATGRDGTVVVSWFEDHDNGMIVRTAVRRGGGGWVVTSPSGDVAGEIDDPYVAVADDGSIAAAWVYGDDDVDELRVRVRDTGDDWAGPTAQIAGRANEPKLAFTPDGELVGAYEDRDTDAVVVVRKPVGDGIRLNRDLAVGDPAESSEPDVAVARDGRVAVVWEDEVGGDRTTRAAVRSTAKVWTTANIGRPGTDVTLPKVAASDDGFVAVWDTEGSDGFGVDAATLGAGSTWGPTEQLRVNPVRAESDVAVAPDGSATVVYEDTDTGDGTVRSLTRPAGGVWGSPAYVATNFSGQKSGPQVAAYDDGSFTAVWRDIRRGDVEVVQAGLLDRTGPEIATTVPSTTTIGVPLSLSADVDDLWNDVEGVQWSIDDVPSAGGPDLTWTPTTLGDHTLVIRAQDTLGNPTVRSFVVRVVPVVVPPVDVPPAPVPPVAAPPAPAPVVPTPVTPAGACVAPYVELVGIRATGTARAPRTRLIGVASPALVGKAVEIRRDGRKVGTSRVGRDRSVEITVTAPHGTKERARARYRLVVGDARSRALQATREATISRAARLRGGRVAVTGRIAAIERATTLTITGTPTCGVPRRTTTTVRTDARGRFRVTLAPTGTAGDATIYRISAPGRATVTLPVVVTAP